MRDGSVEAQKYKEIRREKKKRPAKEIRKNPNYNGGELGIWVLLNWALKFAG